METIRAGDVLAHAKVLSDAKFRGREASTPGARRAAVYIAEEFRGIGLRPGAGAGSYYQVFKVRLGYRLDSSMTVRMGTTVVADCKLGTDFRPIRLPGGKADIDAPCVLVGYGITAEGLGFDEYAGVDVKGKAVIAFSGVPWSAEAARWLRRSVGDRKFGTLGTKARNAAAHGAVCLLVVDDPAGWRRELGLAEPLAVTDTEPPVDSPIPVVHVTRELLVRVTHLSAQELRLLAVEIARGMEPESMPLRGRRLRLKASLSGEARIGRNVIGILPGRDEALGREAVVVGAHYDHLGEGAGEETYFGANDNAAGVGAMLAVARASAKLPRPPRRSLVFAAFDAEEVGRRGSKHYVSHPAIPTDQTVLMINFDMIGRNEPEEINAVGTRSSDELHRLHQEMNRHVGLRLRHPASFRLGLSDHSPFYYAGVPIMYLFGGRDPDYNTPRDTWEKLIPGKLEKVARLAFLTAVEAAERQPRLIFRDDPDSASALPGREFGR